jgi:hypothetical protein
MAHIQVPEGAPGKVAVTTIFPFSRNARQTGFAVRSGLTPGPSIEYPPIGAANPLAVDKNGLATSANELEGMSFFGAVDPVAIAMCAAAVRDGAIVMFCSAQNPFFFNSPIPELSGNAPDFSRSFTMRGVAPSREITIIRESASAGMAIATASETVASEARDEHTRANISRKRENFMKQILLKPTLRGQCYAKTTGELKANEQICNA